MRTVVFCFAWVFAVSCLISYAQDPVGSQSTDKLSSDSAGEASDQARPAEPPLVPEETEPTEVAAKVEVIPENSDARIGNRLQEIMEATGWFEDPYVNVEDGVVFLGGEAVKEAQREWAEKTAMRTSDVVAVVNQIDVRPPPARPFFDFSPALVSLKSMLQDFIGALPLFIVALLTIMIGWFLARLLAVTASRLFARQESKLLQQVVSSVAWAIVFLTFLFIALRISGLTQLASTLLGGTGLIGLALGFAFRDIAENFLSSLLLSLHAPFGVGDLIEVDGSLGFVRKVTTRATVLATFEGNLVQIPNATIYKGKIINYTATPMRRQNFKVGIGYNDSASDAQNLIMKVIKEHPAVEKEPEPSVIVESLGPSTVNLNCLYWFNQREHSGLKVGSALIRQVKQALMDAGVSIPDEARELVFPTTVPVQLLSDQVPAINKTVSSTPSCEESRHTDGEGDLRSEEADVQQLMGESEDDESIV